MRLGKVKNIPLSPTNLILCQRSIVSENVGEDVSVFFSKTWTWTFHMLFMSQTDTVAGWACDVAVACDMAGGKHTHRDGIVIPDAEHLGLAAICLL